MASGDPQSLPRLIGSRWRGASGGVATVERVDHVLVYGKWDSGILWAEHIGCLPKLYVEVDGGPGEEVPYAAP